MRMSRRAGLIGGLKLPALPELWADATIVNAQGASGQSTSTFSGLSIGSTSTPIWLVLCKGDAVEISKVKSNVKTQLRQFRASSSSSYIAATIASGSTTSATKIDIGTFYGYQLMGLRFPSFAEKVIDAVFTQMTFSIKAYNYSASANKVEVAESALSSNNTYAYMQVLDNGTSVRFSVTQGGAPSVPLIVTGVTTAGKPAWVLSSGSWCLSGSGNAYYSPRVGGIYEMHM